MSYVDELEGVLSRRHFLLEQQGFRCLCPRCQANFSGAGEAVLSGWRCQSCSAALREEAIECPDCGTAVTNRSPRERLHNRALQKASQAAQLARARGPAAAVAPLQEAALEISELRPPGSTWRVKVFSMLAGCLAAQQRMAPPTPGAIRCDPGAEAAAAAARELAEQRAAQRAVLEAEASAAVAPPGAPPGDTWGRRLVAALRLQEPSEAALRRGRKRRVGPPQDGGYVVWDEGPEGERLCDVLLGYGVDTNVDFEAELAGAGAKVLLHDHTVPALPLQHTNFVFRREALADKDIPGVAGTLATHLGSERGSIVLKMDVEGAEFTALLATPPEVLARFDQICIELHWLGRPSRGGDFRTKALALERLNENFVLLHAHGNSYGDIVEVAGCPLPDVLEALYVSRRLLGPGDVRPSVKGIPDPKMDVNNCAFVPDVALRGAPFGADLPPLP